GTYISRLLCMLIPSRLMPKPNASPPTTRTIVAPEISGSTISSLSCIRIRYDCATNAKLRFTRPIVPPLPPGRLFFLIACSAQDVGQRVVALLAGVLVHALARLRHRQDCRPRLREGRRIVDRVLVVQRVRVDAAKALDEAQRVGRAAEVRLFPQVPPFHA